MNLRLSLAAIAAALGTAAPAHATDVFKANNTNALNLPASWTGGALPTASDVAVWDTPYASTTSLASVLGGNTSWRGIRVAAPVKVPRIRASGAALLTLGVNGVDMSAATSDFEIYAALAVNSDQAWNVAAGRILNIQGDLQGSGVTLTKSGAGSLTLAGPASNYAGGLVISGGTVQVANGTGLVELAGPLSGIGPLGKIGAGTLALSADNSAFNGDLTLSAGQLNLNHPSALGGGVFVISGGTLGNSSGAPVTLTGNAPLAWNGDFGVVATSILNLGVTPVSIVGSRTVTVSTGTLSIGGNVTGDVGAAMTKLGGGTLEIKTGASIDLEGKLAVGGGTLTLTGGSVACGSAGGSLEIGGGGTVELNGGILSVRAIIRSGASGFLFNGGTLKSLGDTNTFLAGLDSARVGPAGARFDLNGWFVTIAQPLLHDSALGAVADGGLLLQDPYGGGTLALTGKSTYTGPTVIESGVLALGSGGSIDQSPLIDVKVNGTLDAGTSAFVASGQTLQGTGSVHGNLTVASGGNIAPGGDQIGTLTMQDSLTLLGNATFQINKTGATLSSDRVSGLTKIAYGGTLNVTATGAALAVGNSFQLFVADSYSGGFTTFALPTLPAGWFWETSTLMQDGSIKVINTLPTPTFNPSGGSYLGAQVVSITGFSGALIRYTTDGSDPVSSPTAVSGATPVNGIVVPQGSSSFTIKAYQTKSGSPNSPVTTAVYQIVDTGTWTYDGSGNWSDSTKWLAGVVPQGVAITADFSTLSLSSSSTVTLNSPRTIGKLKFGDLGLYSNWSLNGSSLTLDNGANKPVIQVAGNTTTITTQLAGTSGYLKTGDGNLVTQLANSSLSGNAVISQGNVLVDRSFSLGTGVIVLGDAGTGDVETGILQRGSDPWPPAADFGTTNNIQVVAGPTGRLVIGRQSSGNYAANYTGTITLNNNVVFRNSGGDRLSIEGKITGTGNVTIEGNRVNWNSPDNDFVGDLTIAAGGVFQPNALTTIPANCNVTVNGSFGTNSATGETIVIGSLSGTGNVYRLASSNPTLSIGGNGKNGDFQGIIQNDFPVIKTGNGTQLFSGPNTYTGGTIVTGGTLLINNTSGSGTGSGAVVANTNATLGGSGTISGPVTVDSGAMLAPGSNDVGTIGMGTTALAGTYQCQVSGAATDIVAVTGNLNLTGSSLAVSSVGAVTPGTYVIATYTGALTGTFANVTAGNTVDYSTPHQVKLNVTGGGNAYNSWVGGFGLSGNNALATADPDGDGIANSIEFVIGGNPATVQNQSLLPTITLVTNPGGTVPNGDYMRFTYRRTPASAYLNPGMEYDVDLAGTWTSATGAPGVVQVVTPNFYASPVVADKVEVYVPRTNAVNGKIFGRLKVVNP